MVFVIIFSSSLNSKPKLLAAVLFNLFSVISLAILSGFGNFQIFFALRNSFLIIVTSSSDKF
jgi:hypothetical protein